MKNNFLKALFTVLTISILISASAVSAFAQSELAESGEESHLACGGTKIADSFAPDGGASPLALSGEDENTATEGDEAESKSFFSALYNGVRENLGEIFCALTLLGSLVLAVAYKRGLLPLMTKALGAIGGSVGKLGEDAASFSSKISERTERLERALDEAKADIFGFGELLENIAMELAVLKSGNEKIERTERALDTQTEMLFELLMSSSLPQYQKDAVAMKLSDIKRQNTEGV